MMLPSQGASSAILRSLAGSLAEDFRDINPACEPFLKHRGKGEIACVTVCICAEGTDMGWAALSDFSFFFPVYTGGHWLEPWSVSLATNSFSCFLTACSSLQQATTVLVILLSAAWSYTCELSLALLLVPGQASNWECILSRVFSRFPDRAHLDATFFIPRICYYNIISSVFWGVVSIHVKQLLR